VLPAPSPVSAGCRGSERAVGACTISAYVNGNWLERTVIPRSLAWADSRKYGAQRPSAQGLRELAQGDRACARQPAVRKVADFYAAAERGGRSERAGIGPSLRSSRARPRSSRTMLRRDDRALHASASRRLRTVRVAPTTSKALSCSGAGPGRGSACRMGFLISVRRKFSSGATPIERTSPRAALAGDSSAVAKRKGETYSG